MGQLDSVRLGVLQNMAYNLGIAGLAEFRDFLACMQSGVFWGYIGLIEGLIARIKAEYGGPMKVVGTGGLSHQLDGERAGFINKEFDLAFMDSLVKDPAWSTQYSVDELIEKTGTQGIELLMWVAARAALCPDAPASWSWLG